MGEIQSNFAFLLAEWTELAQRARKAEQFARIDPRVSMFYARHTAEHLVDWVYQAEPGISRPYQPDLNALMNQPEFKRVTGAMIWNKLTVIRKAGNHAVHDKTDPTPLGAELMVQELFHVCYWLARTYTRDDANLPADGLTFSAAFLAPRLKADQVPVQQTSQDVAKLADDVAAKDAALALAAENTAGLQAQLLVLRQQVRDAKKRNQSIPDDHDYDEALTRAYLIDAELQWAGWPLDKPEDREFAVDTMPTSSGTLSGKGYVDYVLWGADGLPLAVVEAKRATKDAHVGKQQAKLYADALQLRFGRRPVIYYTNGYEHWIWDDSSYPERRVQGFHSQSQLQLMVDRRISRKPLAEAVIDNSIVERAYQHAAIRAVTEAFETRIERKALVVMATGTGKTRTVVALSQLLMQANWAKRVLFLADRIALVDQAAAAFKTHLPGSAPAVLGRDTAAESRIHVATYPTMMNLIQERNSGSTAHNRPFGVGYYDLIIVDEAHRSIYQKYRSIFDYFDSLLVGLTATPQADVDRNTYSLFDIEDDVPTYAYELNEAIDAGYLVAPRVVPVPLKFPSEGIRYEDLSDAEKEQWDELEWDEDGDIPDSVDPAVVNTWLFNTDTINKALEALMTSGHKVAGGDRLGKTIIFAKNNAHATFIAAQFDKNYPHLLGHFAQVITYQVKYGQTLIKSFARSQDNPHIAISVDMLDTGIDVPEVVNLVFFKPVRSKTKFWQMVGRGTRLCPDLFGPGENKQDFFVFDLCGNVEFFNAGLAGNDGSVARSLAESTFAARVQLLRSMGAAGVGGRDPMVADLVHILSSQVNRLPFANFLVKPYRQAVEKYAKAENWSGLSDTEASVLETEVARVAGIGSLPDTEEAKRFDLLMLRAQLAALEEPGAVETLRRRIQQIAGALAEQPNIPAIAAQLPLIEQLLDDHEWEAVSVDWLELVRKRLRGLVHLIEKKRRKIVYTNFEDDLGELRDVPLMGVSMGGTDFKRYRDKVQAYLRGQLDLAAIQRLRRNKPLTELDLAELERILTDCGAGSDEDLARARQEGLAGFVRSLVGLDRAAVEETLSEFIGDSTLTAGQLDFLNLLVVQLCENGSVSMDALYVSPYSELAPTGPDDLFGDTRFDQLERVLRSFDSPFKVG
ncbi:DEAD/DEAH box helicase family protein [Paenarthrobacter sp. PH39-S1]|uniref:DEAD/DEAH box helicase family protein n=1 Tax=Paenarthrobacter sp. PH39-S1 TaxID=3046204 RepID=UPI0024BB613A|nr:DEAD/DEAH box helicase family protein [Paenarthrobacter sp. PH39-S1]MDJ0355063.1 DEAD/DEAH box helicase family protein [Paenarthrobacter sp. PH39-S1]